MWWLWAYSKVLFNAEQAVSFLSPSTGVNKSDARSDGLSVCVDCVNTEVSTCNMCVNELVAIERVMFKESVNVEAEKHGAANKGVPYNEFTTQFWEVESQGPVQIADVQGRLRKSLAFWQDVVHAPKHLPESIENDYHLPLKFIPPTHYQYNHKSSELHQSFVDEAILIAIVVLLRWM